MFDSDAASVAVKLRLLNLTLYYPNEGAQLRNV